jgi:hypothetical protein
LVEADALFFALHGDGKVVFDNAWFSRHHRAVR